MVLQALAYSGYAQAAPVISAVPTILSLMLGCTDSQPMLMSACVVTLGHLAGMLLSAACSLYGT